ncbi:hypothetical protein KA005_64370 [bacterium]|nr:hypothetical protein [bacterium]
MENRKKGSIDDMNIADDWKKRWCNADVCGCLGCINRVPISQAEAQRVFGRKITKSEWQEWIENKEV